MEMTLMKNIATLIKAAEFLERRDRGVVFPSTFAAEAEHGYAQSLPVPGAYRSVSSKRPKTKKSQGNRTSHNELEKNRRAHLRNCLEILKDIVPLGPEASRHTTLGLLTKAKRFIKNLEDKEKKHLAQKETLNREYRRLRRRLSDLSTLTSSAHNALKRRSVSECSSSTISSNLSISSFHSSVTSSSSPISEPDEVDVTGYSTQSSSDSDDHSSIQSNSSDSGVAMSTSRLTLSAKMVL